MAQAIKARLHQRVGEGEIMMGDWSDALRRDLSQPKKNVVERSVPDFVAALPHPGPLPLGEGESSAALVRSLPSANQVWLRGSLSQRERAGVREKARVGSQRG
ncbi:MAG: hypothetical protein EBS05_26845 [Proteobacteria bacterium]|nr:hypothetical protein [Pseudomonadota bacterium]